MCFPLEVTLSCHAIMTLPRPRQKKKKVERIYTPHQWMEVMRAARKMKPYEVIEVKQFMIRDFQSHQSQFFKKTVSSKRMSIREAKIFWCASFKGETSTSTVIIATAARGFVLRRLSAFPQQTQQNQQNLWWLELCL